MFKVIQKTDSYVYIASRNDMRAFEIPAFARARSRLERKAKIRKPVTVNVEGFLFVFTKNEWRKAKERAVEHKRFNSGLPRHYREEIMDKIKTSKTLSKHMALRIKLDADRAGAEDPNPRQ